MPGPINTDKFTLAHKRWKLRGSPNGPSEAAVADLIAAERLRQQLVREAAYLHWMGRERPFGDPLTDWVAAEKELASGRTARGPLSDNIVDGLLRRQLIEEGAYLHWIGRERPFGDPQADWSASEAELANGG